MARPPKRTPPPGDDYAKVNVHLFGIALQCPSCPRVMVRDDMGGISCVNPDCDMHRRVFKVPTIELVPAEKPKPESGKRLEMPTGDEPPWPHPDSVAAKLMRHIWPEPAEIPTGDKLVRANAKIKELRERLREIEQQTASIKTAVCPACKVWSRGPGWSPDAAPVVPRHLPDCWLKAEIDKLED